MNIEDVLLAFEKANFGASVDVEAADESSPLRYFRVFIGENEFHVPEGFRVFKGELMGDKARLLVRRLYNE